MNNIAMIVNGPRPFAMQTADNAEVLLKKLGVSVLRINDPTQAGYTDKALKHGADCVIAVGGDGTILHAAKKAALYKIPILGINAGRVGFLAGLEPNELSLLVNLINDDYSVEQRMLLSINVDNSKQFFALNDAVVSKGNLSRMIDITITADNKTFECRADGLIAATPTGSTAYSMSAGGPVIDPELKNIMITPICPQTLFARPIIFNSQSVIQVFANAPDNTGAYLTIDGEEDCPLNKNSTVTIKRAENLSVSLIKLNERNFLNALIKKFNLYR